MKKLFTIVLLAMLSVVSYSQTKKVALLETLNGDKSVQVRGIETNMVRGELRKAISNQVGYQAFTRTDIDQLMKEQNFQRSGMVSDAQRKKLGDMSGADYICVSTLTKSNTEFYLEAYLIDVETGEISNPATQYGMLKDGTCANLFQICQDLAQELIGDVSSNTSQGYGGNTYSNKPRNQDFTETAYGLNMRMIYVEGGTFTMGCTSEQSDCDDDETTRQTTVSSFYIGMLEVTQSQWEKVMGEKMSTHIDKLKADHMEIVDEGLEVDGWGKIGDTVYPSPFWPGEERLFSKVGSDYPMCSVSWWCADEFCRRLSEKTGKKYSLPTEAQWEYAARGGNKSDAKKYSGSNSIGDVAWYKSNSKNSVHLCGTLYPNSLGIYDMSGNVYEWCKDYYAESYLIYDVNDPTGPKTPDDEMYPAYVIRGGDWYSETKRCRVSNRDEVVGQAFGDWLGFRVVLVP